MAMSDDDLFADEFIDHVLQQVMLGRKPANRFEEVVDLAQGAYYKIANAGLGGMAEWECAGIRDMNEVDGALREIGATRAADVVRSIVERLRAVPSDVKAKLSGPEFCDCAAETVDVPLDEEAEIFRPLVAWLIRHRREIALLVN